MGRVLRKGAYKKIKLNKVRPTEKTRKQLRKEKRQQKKINRAAYYQKKRSKSGAISFNQKGKKEEGVDNCGRLLKTNNTLTRDKRKINVEHNQQKIKCKKEEKAEKRMKKQRMQQLKQATLEEDKTIKQLEKRLKLNKRKSKSTPKSFVSDGLDCILYLWLIVINGCLKTCVYLTFILL